MNIEPEDKTKSSGSISVKRTRRRGGGPELTEGALGQIIHNRRDRLIYLFGDRAYYLELSGAYEADPAVSYPREIYAQVDAPDQYAPSKNVVEESGSAFEEMMGDFSDFEDNDSYDDVY